MKHFPKVLFLCFVVGIVTTISCKKADLTSDTSATLPTKSPSLRLSSNEQAVLNAVTNEGGTLHFKDQEHLLAVLKALDNGNDTYNDDFFAPLKGRSDDEVTDSMVINKFNTEGFYQAFEEKLNFNSLRADIAQKEQEWLKKEGLNVETDPNNHPVREIALRSVLNKMLKIKIGSEEMNFEELVTAYANSSSAPPACNQAAWRDSAAIFGSPGNWYKLSMNNSSVAYSWGTSLRTSQRMYRWQYEQRFLWWTNPAQWVQASGYHQLRMGGEWYSTPIVTLPCDKHAFAGTALGTGYGHEKAVDFTDWGRTSRVQKYSMASAHQINNVSPYRVFLTW
jgi:hypothetical protein